MSILDRDYVRGKHPPYCTCVACTNKRLRGSKNKEVNPPKRVEASTRNIKRVYPQKRIRGSSLKGSNNIIKIILHLVILSCVTALGIIGYKLFIMHSMDAINGVVIFIILVGVLAWCSFIVKRPYYNYIRPSFKLTALVVICSVLLFAFAGIQPFSKYKDEVMSKLGAVKNSIVNRIDTVAIEERDIPCGTYAFSARGLFGDATIEIILNSDWTYKSNISSTIIGEKEVGIYNTTEEYITFINDLNKQRTTYAYRYSEQFDCLYLYIDNKDEPTPFYGE